MIGGMSKLNRDESGKPIPPRKDWPLTANGNGQWSKKFKGSVYYFGPWDDWRKAEADYDLRWPAITSGKPDPKTAKTTVAPDVATFETVVNLFLAVKLEESKAGKISDSHYGAVKHDLAYLLNYTPNGEREAFRHRLPASVRPADWAKFSRRLEADYGPDARKRMVGLYHSVSRYGAENGYGEAFDFAGKLTRVTKAEVRAARRQKERERGPILFPVPQVASILDECDTPLDAMFLLAINCGFTAADCGALDLRALDLTNGVLDFDRVKTGVQRYAFLWPETVEALKFVLGNRPQVSEVRLARAVAAWQTKKPEGKEAIRQWELAKPDWHQLVFLTHHGQPWVRRGPSRAGDTTSHQDGVGLEFRKVLTALDDEVDECVGGLEFKREGVSFKAGRHTFFTHARAIDEQAACFIMGHSRDDMGEWYDHLDDAKLARIRRVCFALRDVLLFNWGGRVQTNLGTTTALRLVGGEAEAPRVASA